MGAFVAIVIWILASVGFAFYVTYFSSYNKTYGTVAGAIVLLLWIWLTNLALLFGAELDSELERSRQLQSGMAAEETLELPLRDGRGVVKTEERQAKAVTRARKLREKFTHKGDVGDPPFQEPVNLPHPVTGELFASPVPPGTGWPDDPAAPDTPVARSAAGVARLAARPTLDELLPGSPCAVPVRGWWPGARSPRRRSARRTTASRTGAARSPAGALRPRASWCRPRAGRERREPHRPQLHR